MIRYAPQWKTVLRRSAQALESKRGQARWGPAASVKLESVMLQSLYAMRKLIDFDLLSPGLAKQPVAVVEYPYIRKGIGSHWRDFENHYDFSKPRKKTHPPLFIAHQMTDNAIFAPKAGTNGLEAVYLTSNHQQEKALYEVAIKDLVRLFARAAG